MMQLLFHILIVLMADSLLLKEVSFSLSSSHLLFSIAKPCISEPHYHPSKVCTVLTQW